MPETSSHVDRKRGTLLGLAVGDALGAAIEFKLAGAYWGESGIPRQWLEGLARREMIEDALAGLGARKR